MATTFTTTVSFTAGTARNTYEPGLGTTIADLRGTRRVFSPTDDSNTLAGTDAGEAMIYDLTVGGVTLARFSGFTTFALGGGNDVLSLTVRPGGSVPEWTAAVDVDGGDGNDVIWSGAGIDVLRGRDGDDVIHGGPGNDELIDGGDDDDELWGGSGDDVIQGGNGLDTVVGGTGNDAIQLGDGADTVVFNVGDGRDTVTEGFVDGSDVLLVESGVSVTLRDNGTNDVELELGGPLSADSVTIELSAGFLTLTQGGTVGFNGVTYDIWS